jgi:hypothetical protein
MGHQLAGTGLLALLLSRAMHQLLHIAVTALLPGVCAATDLQLHHARLCLPRPVLALLQPDAHLRELRLQQA